MPRGTRTPSLDHPPIRVHKFSDAAYRSGIEEHRIDDVPIKVYDPEKTLADCFKFRNKVGMDVVLEALRLYRGRNFTDSFIESKGTQWTAFRKRLKDDRAPVQFRDVVVQVDRFLTPVFKALSSGKPPGFWKAPGPWT